MKRTKIFAALVVSVVLAVPAAALPAAADDGPTGPSGPPERVVVLTPADSSGQPPTMSADGSYTLTSASGKALGSRGHVNFPAPTPRRTAAQRLAGTGLGNVAGVAHATLAPAPATATAEKGSPSRKDNGVDPAAEDADFESLAAQADPSELAAPSYAPTDYSVQDYEDVQIDDCMTDPATYGADASVRSHLFLCSGSKVTVTAFSCWLGVFCEPVGWVNFTLTTIGRAQDPVASARSVSIISLMRDVIPGGAQPELAMAFEVRLSMNCSAAPTLGSACENDFPEGLTMPMTEWAAYQGGVPFNLTGPSTDGVGADRLSFYDFDTQISLIGANSLTFGAGSFRCDYGRGMNTVTGCVFPSWAERFTRMSLTDPTHSLAAQHIQTALYNPSVTNPPGVNKVIPGLESTGLFSHGPSTSRSTAPTGARPWARAASTTTTTSTTVATSAWSATSSPSPRHCRAQARAGTSPSSRCRQHRTRPAGMPSTPGTTPSASSTGDRFYVSVRQ